MSDNSEEALVDLQIRITHQEAAIEALTQNILTLEKQMLSLNKQLLELQSVIKELMPTLVAPQSQETPPPHY